MVVRRRFEVGHHRGNRFAPEKAQPLKAFSRRGRKRVSPERTSAEPIEKRCGVGPRKAKNSDDANARVVAFVERIALELVELVEIARDAGAGHRDSRRHESAEPRS
jgi:hypothetical protein